MAITNLLQSRGFRSIEQFDKSGCSGYAYKIDYATTDNSKNYDLIESKGVKKNHTSLRGYLTVGGNVTGNVITNPIVETGTDVDGYPIIDPMSSVPVDSDNDGIPDSWASIYMTGGETANDIGPFGYPYIEMYYQWLVGEMEE